MSNFCEIPTIDLLLAGLETDILCGLALMKECEWSEKKGITEGTVVAGPLQC